MAISLKKVEKWAQKKKVGKLLKSLSVDDQELKTAVIKALGATKDENAMNALINLLRAPEAPVRAAAVEALGIMGNSRCLEFVRQLWNTETDDAVREKAKITLSTIKEAMSKEEKYKY